MLLKVSCVAILIAMACLHISCASVKTETETAETKKVAETETETETAKLTEEDTTGERQKRALYYQNDLISNQERQLRKAFPLGVNPIYDYPIYGGVLPVYDYLYYDYLVDPLYPVYPIYPIYDYYDYLYPDYLFPLSAKTPAGAATTKQLRGGARRAQAVSTVGAQKAGTRNLSGRRVQHGAQPLSRVHQRVGGHQQAAAFMNPQHLKQHQSFGDHIPHAFGQAGAPGAAPFAPPPSAAPSYLQQQQKFNPQAQAFNQQQQQQQQQQQDRLKNQFNAIKLASSKGSARNQE